MAQSPRNENYGPTIQGASSVNGVPTNVLINPVTGGVIVDALVRQTAPTASTKTNASYILSYDGDNNVQYIDKTISGVTYRKTLTYTATLLTGISAWVQI